MERTPALPRHVLGIIFWSSQKQMPRIRAWRIVTLVTDEHAVWDFCHVGFKNPHMHSAHLSRWSALFHHSISGPMRGADPPPTIFRLIPAQDVTLEPFLDGCPDVDPRHRQPRLQMNEDKEIRPRGINGRRFNGNWGSIAVMASMYHNSGDGQIGYRPSRSIVSNKSAVESGLQVITWSR
jgi:hypothetical protein